MQGRIRFRVWCRSIRGPQHACCLAPVELGIVRDPAGNRSAMLGDCCQTIRSTVTNRSLMLAFALMAVALQSACTSHEPLSPGANDEYNESAVAQADGVSSTTVHRAQPKVLRAVTPHSDGDGPSSADPSAGGFLKAELQYIGKGGIEANEVDQVLQSRDAFSSALLALDEEAIRSLDAQDMKRHVRAVMLRALGENMTVHSLSCGLSVCMGSVQSGSKFDDTWAHAFFDHGSIKVFGFIEAADQVGGLHERRFLFSMDPELPGIIVPRTP